MPYNTRSNTSEDSGDEKEDTSKHALTAASQVMPDESRILPPSSDLVTLVKWMEETRLQDEARRRREEAERRNEDNRRFEALIAALAPQSQTSPSAGNNAADSGAPHLPAAPRSTPPLKAAAQTPPLLSPDATYQLFREWRRRWQDYATMVDLSSLPLQKQHIQLRMCLTLEAQRVLEHTADTSITRQAC